jgi:hypothetical protein
MSIVYITELQYYNISKPGPGLRLAEQGRPTDGVSVHFSFLPDDKSRNQLPKRCNFTVQTMDKIQKDNFTKKYDVLDRFTCSDCQGKGFIT